MEFIAALGGGAFVMVLLCVGIHHRAQMHREVMYQEFLGHVHRMQSAARQVAAMKPRQHRALGE